MDIFILLLNLGESVFYHWEWCLLWVCGIWPLLCWVTSMHIFWGVIFIINGCSILSKAFFLLSIKMIIWFSFFFLFSFFNLLIWCITLIALYMLKNPGIFRINPTWSWNVILLIKCCWILFASILFMIFASVFISDNGLLILFVIFWSCWNAFGLGMNLGVFLPLQFFGRAWEG